MLSVTVHITGLTEEQTKLTKLSASFSDFSGVLASLGSQLIMFFSQTVFVSEGEALGDPWQQLTTATQTEKDKKWPGRGMEVRTGAMQGSFYDDITPQSLFISNRASYFPYQQLGTSTGPGRGHNIPSRKMLGVNDTVIGMIQTEIEANVRAKIEALNL